MLVKLTKDYRGRETGERFYPSGATVKVDDDGAARLIANGWAVKAAQPRSRRKKAEEQ